MQVTDKCVQAYTHTHTHTNTIVLHVYSQNYFQIGQYDLLFEYLGGMLISQSQVLTHMVISKRLKLNSQCLYL